MSTQHDIEKEAEALSRASPPVQDEQFSPGQTFLQPPQRPPGPKRNRWIVVAASVLMIAMVLGLSLMFIPGLIQSPGGQATPTPTSPSAQITPTTVPTTPTPNPEITPTPPPGVVLGPQACPSGIGDPAHWNAILGTNNSERQVESVSCANIMDNPSLQALVLVRHTNANATLDVYVFNNISSSKPTRIYLLQGLIKGDAKISGYNTIMTAEVDKSSSLNAGKPVSAMTADLFREFDWSVGEKTLTQTAFPGIFPDLTRYQAEADQAQVNAGHQPWKNDAQSVAKALAKQFFGWDRSLTSKVLSGGGSRDVGASVQVQEAPLPGAKQGPTVTVTLSRLEGKTSNMWVAIAAQDGPGALTSVQPRQLVASPVKLEGKASAFENTIGMAYILDHQYTKVGQAIVTGNAGIGMGNSTYSIQVSYQTSFKQGPQEGVVEVQLTSPIESHPYSAVMVKVLLSPQPRVAQGPVSCPIALQTPDYWQSTFGIAAGTVSCANLKGDASLQAVVPVLPSEGKAGRISVFDNLYSARPVQIFSMESASSMISNTSTILTADSDANDQALYREFQWSGRAGTFVQIIFPGMYPDMTHWQAVLDQLAVNQGKDGWKLDAVKTTQNMVTTVFAGGNKTGAATLVKGGGSRDLTAVVNVTFPPGYVNALPVTQVTLSRLEGNLNGIWEVTAVKTNWLYISTPRSGATISSPVTVTGFGPQYEAQIGVVYILDHLYKQIQVGNNFAMAPDGSSPPSAFSLDVKYTSSFPNGAQEGIVELVHAGGPSFDYGVVLTKLLINK